MRFASLGSGSGGNALVVQSGTTCLMLDCGFGLRETESRLARLGLSREALTAIVVTHEHGDHIGGVARIAAAWGLTVHLTYGTLQAARELFDGAGARVQVIDSHAAFEAGTLYIEPFPVPHDAREPVQFAFGDGNRRLGVLTDTGSITPHIRSMLAGCDALVLECNHDPTLLAQGRYPPPLKQRIAGPYGHLANDAAAALLAQMDCSRLGHLIAAHLSRENNRPALARRSLAAALGCSEDWIGVADQDEGFGWRDLR